MRIGNIKVAAAVLFAAAALAAPAAAQANGQTSVCEWNTCASIIDNWHGVKISDGDCDGHQVYANYTTDNGNSGTVRDSNGCGTSASTNVGSGDYIDTYRACQDWAFAPDPCTYWAW